MNVRPFITPAVGIGIGLVVGLATSEWSGAHLALAVAGAVVVSCAVALPLLLHDERRERTRAR